jgi:transcription antitermination factor NusG
MPVLAAEPHLYPNSLFDPGAFSDVSGRAWYVLHAKPRQEKSLARKLHGCGIPFYLPLISQARRIRGSLLISHLPLFPGYVFLLGDQEERLRALSTSAVVRSLNVSAQEKLWHDLTQINRMITSGAAIMPEDRLVPGELVEIRSGPLTGLRGKILERASGRRFLVEIDFIQRGASILVDGFSLAKVT